MRDLLSIGTSRGCEMIGTGIGLGLAGYRINPAGLGPLPALDLWFSNFKNLTATTGPTPSFSRASSGTYFDANGMLQTASTNGARFDHTYNGTSWISLGLLVEEQRTNLAKNSEDFSAWDQQGTTVSTNTNSAPDGNTTADTVLETSATSEHNRQQNTTASTGLYTVSFFVKYLNRQWCAIYIYHPSITKGHRAWFDIQNGAVGTTSAIGTGLTNVSTAIQNCGNGWFRISLTATTAATDLYSYFGCAQSDGGTTNYAGDSSKGYYIWGGQTEAGAFATSYIPNLSTGSTTRSADVCQITGSDFSSFWNASEGSAVADFDVIGENTATVGSFGMVYQFDDNTLNNRIVNIGYETSSGPTNLGPGIFVATGGVAQANLYGSDQPVNAQVKCGFGWKANDFALSVNGAAVLTDTSGTVPTVTQLNLGRRLTDGYLNGHIARLRYYTTRLSNSTLQSLST